jgi:hypothetical protein
MQPVRGADSPSRVAREAAGLQQSGAAQRARVTPRYLGRCERTGLFPYYLAQRLAAMYQCRLEVFLPLTGGGTPTVRRAGRSRTSRPVQKPNRRQSSQCR